VHFLSLKKTGRKIKKQKIKNINYKIIMHLYKIYFFRHSYPALLKTSPQQTKDFTYNYGRRNNPLTKK